MDQDIKNLTEAMGLTQELFERKKDLLEITDKDLLEIRSIGPSLSAYTEKIIRDMEQSFLSMPQVQEITKGYNLETLRKRAMEYLKELLEANYDYNRCLKLVGIGTRLYEAGLPYHVIPIGSRRLSEAIASVVSDIFPEELRLSVNASLGKICFLDLIVIMHSYFYAEEQKLREITMQLERLSHIQETIKELHKHIIRAEDLRQLFRGCLRILKDGLPGVEGVAICTKISKNTSQIEAMIISDTKNQELFKEAFYKVCQICLEHGSVLSLHLTTMGKKVPVLSNLRQKSGIGYVLSLPISVRENTKGALCTLSIAPLQLSQNEIELLADATNDVGLVWAHLEHKKNLEELHLKDYFTGLSKRDLFIEEMKVIIGTGQSFCLVIADIKDLWAINHKYGYSVGDALLREVGQRIKELSSSLLRGRTGDDEFALLFSLQHYKSPSKPIEELRQTLERPYRIQQYQITVSFNMGCALYPRDGKEAGDLLNKAILALRNAKEGKGVERIAFYSADLLEDIQRYRDLEREIRNALEANEFELFMQPRVDVKSRHISGAEALLRWNHPKKGLMPPYQFIPFLEESGWILEVGYWVIGQTCEIIKKLRLLGHNVAISCNISVIQLKQPNFKEDALKVVKGHGLFPKDLRFEITESVLADPKSIKAITDIQKEGFQWEIDDFGTGYSSLLYLKKVPASTLKIDYSFVRGLPDSKEDAEIVKLIVSLAQNLNLKTVAEGIERYEQLVFLTGLGIQEVQGYYFAKPMPVREFLDYMKAYTPQDYFWSKSV